MIRCSSLPLAFRCPGSLRRDDGVLIDPYCEAAEVGTDVHRLLARYPEGDAPKEMTAELSDDARILYFTGAKLWREQISLWMPDSDPEVPFECRGLSGHIDRMAIVGDTIVILDWKSGRKDYEYKHQGFGYAWGQLDVHPECSRATTHFAWLRTQELESYTVSRERADQWIATVYGELESWDGVFHPGDHCSGCRRFHSCPALAEMNRSSLALVESKTVDLAAMDGPQLASTYRRLSPLAKQIEVLQTAIKSEVRARGGVDDGDGKKLFYKQVNGPRKVDTLKAWPVLSEFLADDELAECVDVSISAVESAVTAKATGPRGAKKAAKEKLQAALDKAGAVSQSTTERFTDERKE